MTQADDGSVRDVLEALSSDDPRERVIMLQVLSENPTGSPQVLGRVGELMDDDALTVLSLPYVYGEVRYVAARALVAERRAAGVAEPVVLVDVPSPLGTDEVATLRDRAGLRSMEPLAAYAELRGRGQIPPTTVRIDPARRPPSATVPPGGGPAPDDIVNETLEYLASADAGTRAGTLQHLSRYPTGSPAVAAAVRAMLTDLTPVDVDVPSVYGELRWAAAHALVAEHAAGDVAEPVVLADVPRPLSDSEMEPIAKAAGVGDLEPPATYAALRERNLIPLTTVTLTGAAGDGPEEPGAGLVELIGRVLRFADWARATMCAEFSVRYVSEVAMKARLRQIDRRGTCGNDLRYDVHGNGYDVYAAEGVSLTIQGRGYARADRPTVPGDGVYDYVDLYALRSFLRDWAATTADLDALAEACAEHCRRGALRDAGDLKYELLTDPTAA